MRQANQPLLPEPASGNRKHIAEQLRCAGWRPNWPAATCTHRPASGSRASVERMVGSGSEPTYLPLTNTSFAGLLLYFLGAANALDEVAMAIANASAVLVNMVVSPAGWSIHLVRCVAAFRAR